VLQAVSELKALLREPSPYIRERAAFAISQGCPEVILQAVDDLKAALHDAEPKVRVKAAAAIGNGLREVVLQAMGELKTMLSDANAMARRSAASAIGQGGHEAVLQAVDGLKALLRDQSASVKEKAAWAVGQGLGEAVHQAVGELKVLLKGRKDRGPGVREKAAWAIGQGGNETVLQAMAELEALLKDPVAKVRAAAAEAIGKGGSDAVRQAMGELHSLLHDSDAGVRKSAAYCLQSSGAEFVDHAVKYLRPSLNWTTTESEALRDALDAVDKLGLAAIQSCLPELKLVLRECDLWDKFSASSVAMNQLIIAGAAKPLRRFFMSLPSPLPVDMFHVLQQARGKLASMATKFPTLADYSAIREVESAIDALTAVAEYSCMKAFEAQVGDLLPVKWLAVEAPNGYMVKLGAHGLEAHKCPNSRACPRETINVTVAAAGSGRASASPRADYTCPLARNTSGEGSPCDEGYNSSVAGCAGCLKGWGRSFSDAFLCQRCSSFGWQWAAWLAQPSALLLLSLRSANNAAAQGEAAAFANDVLKITLSFSSSSAVILSSLGTSAVNRNFSNHTKDWLGHVSWVTQLGEAIGSSSAADCLLGRVLSLDELLVMSLVNPAIVLSTAVLVLGVICVVRWWRDLGTTFGKDLMTLSLVAGNLYLPSVAAACAIVVPCYHTQAEDYRDSFRMAYSTAESCGDRWFHMLFRAPLLGLVFIVGPFLWWWLLDKCALEEDRRLLRFLTASYRPANQGWEANRLAKNILLKFAVAAAPESYYPGLQLFLVLTLMFTFTAAHLRCYPYKFGALNTIEASSLCVQNVCIMVSSLAVSESWPLTRGFAAHLTLSAYSLLAINAFVLSSLCVWSRFRLDDGHDLVKA